MIRSWLAALGIAVLPVFFAVPSDHADANPPAPTPREACRDPRSVAD